jgi:branched-subunit amino acid aminotransferase/4-amino-4-deoxychorismate lyase
MEAVAAAAVPGALRRGVDGRPRGGAGRRRVRAGDGVAGGLERQRERGVALASLQLAIGAHARRSSPWLLPGVKSTSYAVNMAAQRRRTGAGRTMRCSCRPRDRAGGPTSNMWFTEGQKLCTPGLDLGILAGVTRDTLLAAAAARGIEVVEDAFAIERLFAADEVFTSSSVREVMPVVTLDERPVGDGKPGPVAAQMQAALRDRT